MPMPFSHGIKIIKPLWFRHIILRLFGYKLHVYVDLTKDDFGGVVYTPKD